ncbi:MAG: hypothetical protein N3G21_07840 [Candidatus Hydrogenedentes bacterium]|nr:hypothetical protein [Candidatus Hydrogenedentota bacterium]
MNSNIVKVIIFIFIVVFIAPLVLRFLPAPLTLEKIIDELGKAGYRMENLTFADSPANESIRQVSFYIRDAWVNIYEYDDEGKIAKYAEMYKKDPGTILVETWGLAQALGSAPSKNKPERVARKKNFLLVVQGEDTTLLNRIVEVFNRL